MKGTYRAAAPGVVLVTVVAGLGMVAVLATSVGLMPLYGQPNASWDGWRQAGPDLRAAVSESLRIAVPASILAAGLGLLIATFMLRGGRAATAVRAACLVVVAIPHLVGASSVYLLLADGGIAHRLATTVTAGQWPELVGGAWPVATVLELAWKESAFVALVVLAALAPGHRERMDVAAGLGATRWQRLIRVTTPTAAPALGAASLVTLIYAIGSYEVAWLLGRTVPEPLPLLAFRLFGSIELADRPAAAAAAATGAALSILLVIPVLLVLPRMRGHANLEEERR